MALQLARDLSPRVVLADVNLPGINVLVVGMGKSGFSAAKLLAAQGARVCTTDARPIENPGFPFEIQSPAVFKDRDLIVISPGVPADMRERIFDPYYTTRTEGTGLGLAIVKKIVVEHGGTIDAGSSPFGGARFRIRIPRLSSPAAQAVREIPPALSRSGVRYAGISICHVPLDAPALRGVLLSPRAGLQGGPRAAPIVC